MKNCLRYGFFSIAVTLAFLMPVRAFAACTVITASSMPVSFGNYNVTMGTSINGSVSATCSLGGVLPSFTVALSTGLSGSFTQRKMFLLTASINYNLYTASSFTTVWGDGTGSSVTQSYNTSSNLGTKSFTVSAQCPQINFPHPVFMGIPLM